MTETFAAATKTAPAERMGAPAAATGGYAGAAASRATGRPAATAPATSAPMAGTAPEGAVHAAATSAVTSALAAGAMAEATGATAPAAEPTPRPLIEACGLTKRYDGFTLDDVTFSVAEGEIVGFVGANGAGKSTTIKALLGLIALDAGEPRVLGTTLAPAAPHGRDAVKEQVGVVFDTVSLPGHLRVSDAGRIYRHAFATWNGARFDKLARDFGLPQNKQVKDLSRGMGMKLSMACALSHDARVLVLDEATAGLDPMARDEALDMLRAFVEEPGRAILMSDHITTDLEKIADRVVGINAGRIIFNVEKDAITDMMGIARCRVADFERIAASGIIPERELRYLRRDYGIDLMVPDRFAFAENFPEVPCDRMGIDDYLSLTLKGGVR